MAKHVTNDVAKPVATHAIAQVAALALICILFASFSVCAQDASDIESVSRHPQEIRALTDPESVLRDLPALLKTAGEAKNSREVALLYLAQANACRVIGDWPCQSKAAGNARDASAAAKLPELEVRSLIAESRSRMAMQDFSRTAQLLAEAERLLKQNPFPELSADVYLAYSSLSYSVGKHAVAGEYAERGLAALENRPSPTIRIRLLRNRARAMAQLGQAAQAQDILKQALLLLEKVKDPKLSAELHLEDARIARMQGDVPTQVANGERILALGARLNNLQLNALGHEVMGLAAMSSKDSAGAESELRLSYNAFRELKLEREERRVLRMLIRSMLGRGAPQAELETLVARSIALEGAVETADRTMAADDFEARIKYAEQEFDVQRLEASAALATQRESALASQQRLALVVAILSIGLFLVLGVFFLWQRRFSDRLERVVAQLQESESRYRMLAENSRDMVVRMRPDGRRLYVSPASRELLGLEPSEFTEPRWDLVHPDDREKMVKALRDLGENGGSLSIAYRARHANGEYVWLEVLAQLVRNEAGGPPEIVYAARDITARVRAEEALSLSESRIRAITDNIPAMIARVDTSERYTFANAFIGEIFGLDPAAIIGRTMLEVRGPEIYATIKPHIDAALQGNMVNFEGTSEVNGQLHHYQSSYVPDLDAQGRVQGFFALTFDITERKLAEEKLDRLSRVDSLTGVANRRHFEERLDVSLARSRRQKQALALLCLDIDHFKLINDTHGHPFGDAVIVAFSERLRACIRESDLVARIGGDEFVLLMENPAIESAENVARKLLSIMQEPVAIEGKELVVSASIGLVYSANPESARDLMDLADRALYAAKAAGRNTFRTADAT
ncbi:MAG: diguanylate cyclase [Betaproteobacteria bacterium]